MNEVMLRGVPGFLYAAIWFAFWGYWIIAGLRGKRTARRESFLSRLGHVLPLAVGIWLLIPRNGLPHTLLDRAFLPPSAALLWVGMAMLCTGLAWTIWARRHLAGNWSAEVAVKHGHQLIRTGPYAFTRHPIYSGLLLAFLGSAVAVDRWRGLLAVAVILASFWRKLRLEERFMRQAFPHDYARFQAEVPALVPRMARRRTGR